VTTSIRDFNKGLIEDLRANAGKASGGPFAGRDVLILTTKGAKTGEPRETPLVFSRDGAHLVIIASKGGSPSHPAWYHNLRANPIVTVEAMGEKFAARAHIAEGGEYERLYGQHAEINPAFHQYRARTSRKIPVVVLERIPNS
jgi:deazaflavin-dependent oxidoreductase (nitroreductase family)